MGSTSKALKRCSEARPRARGSAATSAEGAGAVPGCSLPAASVPAAISHVQPQTPVALSHLCEAPGHGADGRGGHCPWCCTAAGSPAGCLHLGGPGTPRQPQRPRAGPCGPAASPAVREILSIWEQPAELPAPSSSACRYIWKLFSPLIVLNALTRGVTNKTLIGRR